MSKILFVVDHVPETGFSGSGVTATAVVHSLLYEGHTLTILALADDPFQGSLRKMEILEYWKISGVGVQVLEEKYTPSESTALIRRVYNFFLSMMKPDLRLIRGITAQNLLESVAKDHKVDKVLGYHWNAAAAIRDCKVPAYLVLGDPLHLPLLFSQLERRSEWQTISLHAFLSHLKKFRDKVIARRIIKVMVNLMRDMDGCAAFAAHHSKELGEMAGMNCDYIHTPVPDPGLSCKSNSLDLPFRILHIGHLQGTATLSGVELIVNEVLPVFEEKKFSFVLTFVGAFAEKLPAHLKIKLNKDCIKFKGQVSPPDEEFNQCHCLLVATPIELGIRVRIITAFSFGTCVVAHRANVKGIPELVHGYNCLLGDTGEDLAAACIQVSQNKKLRQMLEFNARVTYENYFSINVVGRELSKFMEHE